MAWLPRENAIDTRLIESNILAFIATNQEEALAWANGEEELKKFNFLAENLENKTKPGFPSLAVTGDEEAIDYDSDLLQSKFQINFEAIVLSRDSATLPSLTKKYAHALKSMLANIPQATLVAGLTGLIAKPDGIATTYGETLTDDQETAFFQVFQVKAIYNLYSNSYL